MRLLLPSGIITMGVTSIERSEKRMSEQEIVQAEEPAPSTPPTVAAPVGPRVCFVKFRNAGRVYPFAAGDLELLRGDLVLAVEHEQTQQVGSVMRCWRRARRAKRRRGSCVC